MRDHPTEPPPPPAIVAWARLQRGAARALAGVERDLAASGLPPLARYDVLLELRRAQEAGERLRQRDLAARLLLAGYSLSRLLDRMAADGQVARVPCDEDGRGAYVEITADGLDLQRRMWPVYAAAIRRHFADRYAKSEIDSLGALLGRL